MQQAVTAWLFRRVLIRVVLAAISIAPLYGQDELPVHGLWIRNQLVCADAHREWVAFDTRDEVWKINVRSNCPQANAHWDLRELQGSCWVPRSLEDWMAREQSAPERLTLHYVHGNRTDADWAISRASQLYQNLFRGDPDRPPLRFVIWQWKSEKEQSRPLADFQAKARRARGVGSSLSRFLAHAAPQRTVLMGYSLGAQVILSALSESPVGMEKPTLDVVLIAPVLDCGFAACPVFPEQHSSSVRQTLIFENSCDRVVRCAERACRSAVGSGERPLERIVGMGFPLGPVTTLDLRGELENRHSVVNYTGAPTMRSAVLTLITQ